MVTSNASHPVSGIAYLVTLEAPGASLHMSSAKFAAEASFTEPRPAPFTHVSL